MISSRITKSTSIGGIWLTSTSGSQSFTVTVPKGKNLLIELGSYQGSSTNIYHNVVVPNYSRTYLSTFELRFRKDDTTTNYIMYLSISPKTNEQIAITINHGSLCSYQDVDTQHTFIRAFAL